jgi:hypothetical protein
MIYHPRTRPAPLLGVGPFLVRYHPRTRSTYVQGKMGFVFKLSWCLFGFRRYFYHMTYPHYSVVTSRFVLKIYHPRELLYDSLLYYSICYIYIHRCIVVGGESPGHTLI